MKYQINQHELIDEYEIDINSLYQDSKKQAFIKRLGDFIKSDSNLDSIMSLNDEVLSYSSESFIPRNIDPNKRNVMFILGNPAPESIALRSMFSFEANGKRYHRFWRVLHDTGVLEFDTHPNNLTPGEKMERLYKNDYNSPFNLLIVPFYSLPSAPGGDWGGVSGVKRLYSEAFRQVESMEKAKIKDITSRFLRHNDLLVTFQKDAFVNLSREKIYNYKELLKAPFTSELDESDVSIKLMCLPPTRLLYSNVTKNALKNITEKLDI